MDFFDSASGSTAANSPSFSGCNPDAAVAPLLSGQLTQAITMPFPKGQNPNHPTAGSTIKVEPIRDKKAITRIKKILADRPRDLCLFTLGIQSNEIAAIYELEL